MCYITTYSGTAHLYISFCIEVVGILGAIIEKFRCVMGKPPKKVRRKNFESNYMYCPIAEIGISLIFPAAPAV